MQKDFVAHFTVEKGRVVWKNQRYMDHMLPQFEGKSGVLTIKKKFNKRSLRQNAYYWKCLEIISSHTGHTEEELHRIFKGLFAPRIHLVVGKRKLSMPKGTSQMGVGEMIEYMERVVAEAASMGIVLMTPQEFYQSEGMLA